ncbi:MAG: cytochrome b5 domain-containing protein [Bacillota bacterium]
MIAVDRYSFLLGRVHEITARLGRYRTVLAQLPCSPERRTYELLFSDEADQLLYAMNELAALPGMGQTVQSPIAPPASQSPSEATNQPAPSAAPPGLPTREFTAAELAEYDGSAGRPAYVAVNGVVYDMSTQATWGGGSHFGLLAGSDLTAQFAGCHGQAPFLSRLPVVGTLATQTGG